MTAINESILETKHFCILPWVHFHALPNKKVLPCCMANSDLPVSNTDSKSILHMMNTEEYKKLRLNMLNDQPSDPCQRCYEVEKLGTWSMRQSNNAVRGKDNLNLVKSTKLDGTIDKFKLKYLDIRWSNICNFKCRSCGPEFSSLHAKEFIDKKEGKAVLKKTFRMEEIVVSNNKDGTFFEKMEPYLHHVEEVYFAGGESLITPEHYQLLDFWIENNLTDIKLTYTTNFSVFKYKDKNVIDYWKKFKNVEIFASLDGMGSVAEYMRSGTVWSEIEENIKMVKAKTPHVQFHITPTISIWNVHQFPEFYEYMVDKQYIDPTIDGGLRLNVLTHPWYANISILPYYYRKKLINKWRRIRSNGNYDRSVRNAFAVCLEAFKSKQTTSIEGLEKFFETEFATDNMRGESLFKSIPELKEVYEWMLEAKKVVANDSLK
jgi:hypothetical protein